MATLDDLLGFEEHGPEPEPPARSRTDTGWWWLLKAALLAAVVAVPVWGLFRLVSVAVPYPLIFMVFLVGRTLRTLLQWIAPQPLPDTMIRPSGELVSEDQAGGTTQDGLDLATGRWDTRLSWAGLHGTERSRGRDASQFARTVQPKLVEIIDERLWLRHAVSRAVDPVRAQALLGEQLWGFVTQPVTKNPSPRDIAGLIALMEQI
jgi:hypothetical protein